MAASSSASAGWQLVSVDHAAVIDIPHDALCLQLGRNQLAEAASKANAPQVEFAFVSRVQLALTAGTEGALKLESLGTNAILVSSGGTGPWEKLCRGETRTLLAGDKIAFDNKCRTGTVVQLRRRGTPPPSCRWLWDSGRGADERWTAYSSVDSAEIERQFIAGADRCALGAERHVDFSSMRQVRNDNPSRYRGVRREVIAGAAGASASSDAAPAHAAARREAMTDPPAEDAAEELAPEPKRQRLVEGGEERERRDEPIQAAGLPSALSPLSGSQDAAGSASSPSASVVGSTPAPMQAFTLTPGGGHSPAPASTTLSSAGRAAPTVPLPGPLVSPQAAPAPPDIFFFWGAKSADGPRACLSNFYVAPFVEPSAPNTACSPRRFFCMEQFMVLKKAELFGDADASSAVMALTSDPAACKKIGRAVRGVSEQRWAAVARDIVEDGAYLKFSQNPPLARFLVSTAARMLVEASPYDRIWGIGFSERDAMRRPRTEWGSNWLGQALMKVRARLADGTAEGLYGISDAPVDASPAAAIILPALSAGTSQAVDLSSDDEKDDAPASGVALAPFDSVVGALAPVTSRAAAASAPLAASAASAVVSAAASAAASLAAAPAASFPPAKPWASSAYQVVADDTVPSFAGDPTNEDKASLVPQAVASPHPSIAHRDSAHDALLYRRAKEAPRARVAGFDVDGTLLRWTCAGWPARLDDYALWSAAVVPRIRALHAAGYKIVLFGNRANIQGAFTGSNAKKTMAYTDWLAAVLRVPLHAVYATRSKGEGARFYKPQVGAHATKPCWPSKTRLSDYASDCGLGLRLGLRL